MHQLALERRPDGSASIFDRGRRYRREPGNDGRWSKRTSSGFRAVSRHRALRLEHAYQHRDQLKEVRRYSRRSAEDIVRYDNHARLRVLATEAVELIERGREANVKLGRIFNESKGLLPHGEWKPYFAGTFEPRGISLRTATEYMRMARQEDQEGKKADSALFPETTDALKRKTDKTDAAGKDALEAATAGESKHKEKKTEKKRKTRPRLDGTYWFPLNMTGAQKNAMDLFLQSKQFPKVQRRMLKLLEDALHKYGFLKNSNTEASGEEAAA